MLTCFGQYTLGTSQVGLKINIGANLAFGTHFRRLGCNVQLSYVQQRFQANTELRVYYNFKNLGPPAKHPELVFSQGVLVAFGAKTMYLKPFLQSVSNQTDYSSALAYAYNTYWSANKTTQQTGSIAIHIKQFSVITENDILARPMYDRFRTAAFLVQYQIKDRLQVAVNCSMWTGEFRRKKEITNVHFFHGCYMDTIKGKYTQYSQGLLSVQVKYQPYYYNTLQANVGIDAEQVRNAVQNKFIHDMPFLPKKLNKARNCHIPMLDDKGNAYLYEPEQHIRNSKLFINLFSNANVFY